MTLIQLLRQSFQSVNIFRPNESIPASDLTDAWILLNALCDSLNIGTTYSSTRESKVLTSGMTIPITWGTGGVINTARPIKLNNAYLRDGTTDYPIEIISQQVYDSISQKADTGRPRHLYYNPTYPLGNIYLHYIPDASYTLFLDSEKDFGDFNTYTAEMNLPKEYELPLITNLGVLLCGPYEREVPASIAGIAESSLRRLKRLLASQKLKPVKINAFPASIGGTHYKAGDILSGEL